MKNRFVIVLLICCMLCGCTGKINYVTKYVTNCETVELRDKPSNDGAIVKILNQNDIVSYEKDVVNGYSKIVYDGHNGYVLSKYLTDQKPQAEQKEVVEPDKSDIIVSQPEKTVDTDVNLLNNMTKEQIREVNIFLSNFSEASYGFYYTNADEAKIAFAFLHSQINQDYPIVFENNCMGISAKDVDNVLIRFFGHTVPHKTPVSNKQWKYNSGKFLVPEAWGETKANFTIATDMRARADGNYNVYFNVYWDETVDAGSFVEDKAVYYMTDSQASENSRFSYSYNGSAVLKPKVYNGSNTYELVSYSINY